MHALLEEFIRLCALNYSTISVATAVVSFVMAFVLLLIRGQILKRERWLLYLGLVFSVFFLQYAARATAALLRGGDYSMKTPNLIEQMAQSFFSNLNSLFILLSAFSLLYRLPLQWWKTRWQALIYLVTLSCAVELIPGLEWARWLDGYVSAASILILSYAMYKSSGPRQRWMLAFLNLVGGVGYASIQIIFAHSARISSSPSVAALFERSGVLRDLPKLPPERVLDSLAFALAFGCKVGLFVVALLVVMRCLAAFSLTRSFLNVMKKERGEFLGSNGLLSAMADNIGADVALLYFRLPSTGRKRLISFYWSRGQSDRDFMQEDRWPSTAELSLIGEALTTEEIEGIGDARRNPAMETIAAKEFRTAVRSVLNVPLQYHGAMIGSLHFGWKQDSAFTAAEVQRVRQIANFVTPIVQAERWLRAVASLREQLQPYMFIREDIERGTFMQRLVQQVYDVLSPVGVLVILNFGFRFQWGLVQSGMGTMTCDGQPWRTLEEVEDYFCRVLNGGIDTVKPVPLMFEGQQIGKLLIAAQDGHDPLEAPSLTQDEQQLRAIAVLIKDVIFDLQRKRFSAIIYRLQSRLGAGVMLTESTWMQCVRQAAADAGIQQAAVIPDKSQLNIEEPAAIAILHSSLRDPQIHGGYTVYRWSAPDAPEQSVLELRLPSSRETLHFVIHRRLFGSELGEELAWRLFFDRLTGAADAALMRIQSMDLEREATKAEMGGLLVHELTSHAIEFTLAAELMDLYLKSDENSPLQRPLASLRSSVSKFRELAMALDPVQKDTRAAVPLTEVFNTVSHFCKTLLKEPQFIQDGTSQCSIRVPFEIAYLTIITLVRNSIDALGAGAGRLRVVAEATLDCVLVHVDDDGCGVSPEMEKKLFRPKQTTKPNGKGVALWISRRSLRRYGGDLLHTKPAPDGFSTRFTTVFPKEAS